MKSAFRLFSYGLIALLFLFSQSVLAGLEPVVQTLTKTLKEDQKVVVNLNGKGSKGTSLSYSVSQSPQHGSVSINGNKATYTPYTNYFGPDEFQYQANDGVLYSAPANVNLTITPVNDIPLASSQTVNVGKGAPSTITLIASDVEGEPLTYRISAKPKRGKVTINGNLVTYTPKKADFQGKDRFSFKSRDGKKFSKVAWVNLEVIPGNLEKGVFLDSAVEGVQFKTSSGLEGYTNAAGEYQYIQSDTVEFFIGDISLGKTTANGLLTTNDFPFPVQVAQFLQTLDEDSVSDNGIQITQAVRDNPLFKKGAQQITESGSFADSLNIQDFSGNDQNIQFIEAVSQQSLMASRGIVSEDEAYQHQQKTEKLKRIKQNNPELYSYIDGTFFNAGPDLPESSNVHKVLASRLAYYMYVKAYQAQLDAKVDMHFNSMQNIVSTQEEINNFASRYLNISGLVTEVTVYATDTVSGVNDNELNKDTKRRIMNALTTSGKSEAVDFLFNETEKEVLSIIESCIVDIPWPTSISDLIGDAAGNGKKVFECALGEVVKATGRFVNAYQGKIAVQEYQYYAVSKIYLDAYFSCGYLNFECMSSKFGGKETLSDQLQYIIEKNQLDSGIDWSVRQGASIVIDGYIGAITSLANDIAGLLPSDSFFNYQYGNRDTAQLDVTIKPLRLSQDDQGILWVDMDIKNLSGRDIYITSFEPRFVMGSEEFKVFSDLYGDWAEKLFGETFLANKKVKDIRLPISLNNNNLPQQGVARLVVSIDYMSKDRVFSNHIQRVVDLDLAELWGSTKIEQLDPKKISLAISKNTAIEGEKYYLPDVSLGNVRITDQNDILWELKPRLNEVGTGSVGVDQNGIYVIAPFLRGGFSSDVITLNAYVKSSPNSESAVFTLNVTKQPVSDLDCTTPWRTTLNSGSSITAYQSTHVQAGSTCAKQTRTCTNGKLSGSYLYPGCTVGTVPATSNITLSNASVTPSSLYTGGSIKIDATLTNTGTAPSAVGQLSYFIGSTATKKKCADVPALFPAVSVSTGCVISAPATAGTYNYGVCYGSQCSEASSVIVTNPIVKSVKYQSETAPHDACSGYGAISGNCAARVQRGDSFTKTWTFRNNGNVDLASLKVVSVDQQGNLSPAVGGNVPNTAAVGVNFTYALNFIIPKNAQAGVYKGQYKLQDVNGDLKNLAGNTQIFWYAFQVPQPQAFEGALYPSANEILKGENLRLGIKINNGESPYLINLNWGDGSTMAVNNVSNDEPVSLTYTYSTAGNYLINAEITDQMGEKISLKTPVKVTDSPANTTTWQGSGQDLDTSESDADIPIRITGDSSYSYKIDWKPEGNASNYFTKYRLSVPSGLMSLGKKIRLTVASKGFFLADYDRALTLVTNTGKHYTSAILAATPGFTRYLDLSKGEEVKSFTASLQDSGAGLALSVRVYALELTPTGLQKTYLYGNGKYTQLHSKNVSLDTSENLSLVDISFKGVGQVDLAILEYDKNGDGAFDASERYVLTTQTGEVEWQKSINSNACLLPWGGQIDDGASITAFQTDVVQDLNDCVSEVRTCSAGILSGSFEFSSCPGGGGGDFNYQNLGPLPSALLSPNGGEIWLRGAKRQIMWDSNAISGGTVSFYVLHDDPSNMEKCPLDSAKTVIECKRWYLFAKSVSNDGGYFIDPAALNGTGNAYLMLIKSDTDPKKWDISNSTFTLD